MITDTSIVQNLLVKVQFRRPELYKEKQGINQEETYLPRIFKPFYFNWHFSSRLHWVLMFNLLP